MLVMIFGISFDIDTRAGIHSVLKILVSQISQRKVFIHWCSLPRATDHGVDLLMWAISQVTLKSFDCRLLHCSTAHCTAVSACCWATWRCGRSDWLLLCPGRRTSRRCNSSLCPPYRYLALSPSWPAPEARQPSLSCSSSFFRRLHRRFFQRYQCRHWFFQERNCQPWSLNHRPPAI